MVLVGVYGTLKQGNHNHDERLNMMPIFSGQIKIKAKMYTNGRYPMLVKTADYNEIFIEIYNIDEVILQRLDDLELPFGYHREQLSILDYKGVWVYFYSGGVPPSEFRYVEEGNFEKEEEW